ncbi:putative photosystem II [Helianthus anomalus]
METVLSPSHSRAISNHPKLPLFRDQAKASSSSNQKICKSSNKFVVYCCKASEPIFQNGVSRRDTVLFGLATTVATMFPIEGSSADEDLKMAPIVDEDLKMAPIVDELNAYSFLIPLEMPSKKFTFKWVESRKPERYSSAAPLSPNARLRIVSERVDFIDNLILSITIGPPNPTFLKTTDKSTWTAKDVADSVLSDKSALRVTSSQRMAESSVLDAHTSEIDGEPYWYYEYLVRKSPTKTVSDSNIFRHYLAASVERDGFLYSLNASTLNKQWDMMGPVLEKTVASFRLLPATESYVPPYKDPWRFW